MEDGLPGWTSAERGQLGQELSDVLNNLIRLAKRCHVDHPSAVLDKMVLNGQKYPVSRAHGSSLKYTSFVEEAAAQSKEPWWLISLLQPDTRFDHPLPTFTCCLHSVMTPH